MVVKGEDVAQVSSAICLVRTFDFLWVNSLYALTDDLLSMKLKHFYSFLKQGVILYIQFIILKVLLSLNSPQEINFLTFSTLFTEF